MKTETSVGYMFAFFFYIDIHGTEPQAPQTYLKLSDETHSTHAVGFLW